MKITEFGPWKLLNRKGKYRRRAKKGMERTRKKERKNWLDTGSLPLKDFKLGFGKSAQSARKYARKRARDNRRKR